MTPTLACERLYREPHGQGRRRAVRRDTEPARAVPKFAAARLIGIPWADFGGFRGPREASSRSKRRSDGSRREF